MQHGAIILCGGTNRRMGTDKAWLPFGPGEVMLQRVVRLVTQVVPIQRTVCVAAAKQQLPSLAEGVRVIRDPHPLRGPLEGLVAGLTALRSEVNSALVTSCDVPLLMPALIERLFSLLGDHQIVVPQDGPCFHPLAAIYRLSVLPEAVQRLAKDQLRLHDLLSVCQTYAVPVAALRDIDPTLASLSGCNDPDEYHRALRQAGFTRGEDLC